MSDWEKSFPHIRYIWFKAHICLYAKHLSLMGLSQKNSVGSNCIADILWNTAKRAPKCQMLSGSRIPTVKLLTVETEQFSLYSLNCCTHGR